MKARGYCRTFGESLPNTLIQEKQIRDHCSYKNYELVQIYYDREIPGKTIIRPALQSLLVDIKSGEYLIFPTLAILCETIKDLLGLFENLKIKGINIVCLEHDLDFTTSIGNIILNSFIHLFSLEKNMTSKIVSEAMQKRSKEGKIRTRPPFGYEFVSKNEDFRPVPQQQRIIAKIKELYEKDKNLSKVAKQLNDDGDNYFLYENRKNPPPTVPFWKAEQVKRILTDHGVLAKGNSTRMNLTQRIINHRDTSTSSTSSTSVNTATTSQGIQTISIPNNVHNLPTVPSIGTFTFTDNTKPISIPIKDCSSDEECSESDS